MAEKKSAKSIQVETGLSPGYAKSVLITDIDCKDSLLDLIDNSIDSAKIALLDGGGSIDERGMPDNYSGYEVNIGLDGDVIIVEDNCNGVRPDDIQSRLLKIGEQSNQPLSIGHFGVGLKRSLLKLGKKYTIRTSHNGEAYKVEFEEKELLDASKPVVANYEESSGSSSYTKIIIENLTSEAKREIFNAGSWMSQLSKEVGVRYSLFLKKGLVIKCGGVSVLPSCPGVRSYKSISIQEDYFENVPGGVSATIRAGLHEDYKYKEEVDGDPAAMNERLTGEYGWYYVCNDRVVKIACTDPRFGWAKKWHPEYYGFIGWVYFTGDVGALPWNTKKTDIDPSSEVFLSVKDHLKDYASKFRSQNRSVRKKKPDDSKQERDGKSHGSHSEDGSKKSTDSGSGRDEGVRKEQDKPSASPAKNQGSDKRGGAVSDKTSGRPNPPSKIGFSQNLLEKLNALNSNKLLSLYSSLTQVSLNAHPVLVYVGVWSFFETLARRSGAIGGQAFNAYFNGKANQWLADKKYKATVVAMMNRISEEGNLNKHDPRFYTVEGRQLANIFEALEPFVLIIIEEILKAERDKGGGS